MNTDGGSACACAFFPPAVADAAAGVFIAGMTSTVDRPGVVLAKEEGETNVEKQDPTATAFMSATVDLI